MITQTYFIGTGALSAMFTLNAIRTTDDASVNAFMRPHYICNLAAAGEENEQRAIDKAREYADAMRERMGETDDFKVVFGGVWDDACNERRGKLSVRDTNNIEAIEAGRFPFGKHAGTRIVDAPEGYVLFFADKFGKTQDVVTNALAAACQGVALEKGYIARRDDARAERAALDALSAHVGAVGDRLSFTGEIVSTFFKRYFENEPENGYWIVKVRCGQNLIAYIGSKELGERGDVISFKATVKSHNEYKGVKETQVSRPAFAK